MKRLLSLVLSIAVMLVSLSSLAEVLPSTDANQFPVVGDVVEGFEVREIREIPLVGATVVLFEHQQTGAGLMYLANEDTNRVFDLTFLTRPTDNTGLPHVFEHSTLDGSEKYPPRNLFFNLSYQTYNTYMNASTYSVMTTYPVASLSEAQLLKYADYYTDSCLHPMILQDESIFREEAWRYRMATLEDDLTIEGTVYSEMLGATTLERMASMNRYRTTFPGSVVGFDHGGDPAYIPDMTWEKLKEYHELYYHPSNCVAYLYGQFDDYTAFLALLNEAFSSYEKQEFQFSDAGYTALTSSVEQTFAFPMEAGASAEHTSVVYYSFVCPGLKSNAQEEMILNTLTDLLVADSSPLSQSLKKAFPYGSFSCYIDTSAPDDAITFYGSNLNPEDAALFRETVDTTLKDIAENGFLQEMVDGVMASTELAIKLTPESSEVGVNLIPSIAHSYATSGNPFSYFDYVDGLSQMNNWNQAGLYQEAVSKWLVGSQTTALVTTYPDPGQKEVNDAALSEKLAALKASMTDEEKQAIIDAANTPDNDTVDSASMLASLQAVTVDSLPEEIKQYTVLDETGTDGIRRIEAYADMADVGRIALFLDAKGLPQDQIHYFKLFVDLLGKLDTDTHAKEEFDLLSERYLYGREARLSLVRNADEDYVPYLRMGWTGMDEDFAMSYDLMYELVFGTQFTDVQKLRDQVQGIKSSLHSTINSSAYTIMLYRALGKSSALYRYYNYFNYLDYYAFIEQIEALLESNPESVIQSLQGIQSYFNNADKAVSMFAGSKESAEVNRPLADAFLKKLDKKEISHVIYDLPSSAQREAVILDLNVNFNALVTDYPSVGLEEYEAGLDAIMSLVSDMYLIPQLRDQYGVYSPMAGAIDEGGIYMLTYRDPNITETFEVYESLADQIASLDVDQATLDGYILSSYSYYATSSGELSGALSAALNQLEGNPQDQNIEYMQQLKAVTPEKVKASADLFRKIAETGIRSTAGSASAIQAHADLYDVILNPFNAKDSSEIEFADAGEGSEHYAAVRYAFENGLMNPLEETTFGVDAPASVGDVAQALYVLIGGAPNAPQDAIDFLSGYGIVPADAQVDTVLTNGLSDIIFVNFGAAVGMELQPDEPSEKTDLPQTRGELAENIYLLFGE